MPIDPPLSSEPDTVVETDCVIRDLLCQPIRITAAHAEDRSQGSVSVRCGNTEIYAGSNQDLSRDGKDALRYVAEDAAVDFFTLGMLVLRSYPFWDGPQAYQKILKRARENCIRLLLENTATLREGEEGDGE